MVFTHQSRFRAVAMFPGRYEVEVTAPGMVAERSELNLIAGDNPALTLTMTALPPGDGTYMGATYSNAPA
jgi:hypothetical protein